MPKGYVEVGCSNSNVIGKNISFCIFANRVPKKESEVGKMGSSNEVCKRRWQPMHTFLERFVTA